MLTIYDATWANVRSASSYANGYTYTGRQLDTETGLYYYRARVYAAQLGRFTARTRNPDRDRVNLLIANATWELAEPSATEFAQDAADAKKCKFKICSSPILGGTGGHLFILCNPTDRADNELRYRAGPGRDPKDPPGTGLGLDKCECRTKGRGQLVPSIQPWREKPVDHPGHPKKGYDPGEMDCVDVTAEGQDCQQFCGCLEQALNAIEGCCIPYCAAATLGRNCGNSNSAVGWMLKACLPSGKGIDIVPLPGAIRPNPGVLKPLPKCVEDELKKRRIW